MTVVFKLGGSLMSLSGLAKFLRDALELRSSDRCLVIAGGGESADIVRKWSQLHELSDEDAHWLALSSLDLNRLLIQKMLKFHCVGSRADAELFWGKDHLPLLLNLKEFVEAEEACRSEQLPHDWSVTSDSLAAWTAILWPANELVLLKSIPSPVGQTAEQASQNELVDDYFPQIAKHLPQISWCNIRASKIVIEPWLSTTIDFSEKSDGEN